MKNIIFTIFLILSVNNLFAGNQGKNAMDCVTTKTTYSDKSNLKFKNSCNHKVFIAWCGDLRNSKKTCGDGRNNTFFTHYRNLGPHETYRTELKPNGLYKYAACKGSTDYGHKGIIHDNNDKGGFTCTKTGSFAKVSSNKNKYKNVYKKNNSRAIGRWDFVVQQENGKWHSQVVVLRDNGVAFYIYADEKYYFARWQKKGKKIKVYVFTNKKQYNKNSPAFTLVMNKKDNQFKGEVIMHKAKKSFNAKGYKR